MASAITIFSFTAIVVVALIVVVPAVIYWNRARDNRMNFPGRVRAVWIKAGRDVPLQPVLMMLLATRPRRVYSGLRSSTSPGILGALGVVDRVLVMEGMNGESRRIPLDAIRWIGTKTIRVQEGKYANAKEALVIHSDDGGQWQVFVFVTGSNNPIGSIPAALTVGARVFARELAQRCQTELHQYFGGREDFGPAHARQMNQDMLGQWHAADGDDSTLDVSFTDLISDVSTSRESLYLAPDRLIYGWKEAIHLSQIRGLDVYAKGVFRNINPFAQDLLRIEYDADGKHFVTGFLVHRGEQWGAELSQRTGIPCDVQEGRKKKQEL